tara:strand:+ start:13 stop:618 length:606 start_codon:yes stop_codon:yes gene_type:complete
MKSIDKERMLNNFLYVLLVFFIVSCSYNDEVIDEPFAPVNREPAETGSIENKSSALLNGEPIERYSIENLQWIEGFWLDSTTFSFRTPKVSFMEKWEYYPDSISGMGISIKENDTTIMEALCIREVNGKINYIARPVGEAIIGFPLIYMSDNEAVFENLVNDFPQKIKYIRISKESLHVIISGIIPQGERVVTFKMRSVSF